MRLASALWAGVIIPAALVGVNVNPIAGVLCFIILAAIVTLFPRAVYCLEPNEQLRIHGFTGVTVKNGPGIQILNPFGHRDAEVVKAITLGPTSMIRVKDTKNGEERIISGPKMVQLGPFDEQVGGIQNVITLNARQYLIVVDKLTGEKRIERGKKGPMKFVPGPQDEPTLKEAEKLGRSNYMIVENSQTGIRRIVDGPTLWFPEDPNEQRAGAIRAIVSLKNDEYIRIKDSLTGKQWIEKGESKFVLQPTWEADKIQKAVTLKAWEYLRLLDTTNGKVTVHTGPQTVFPGAYDQMVDNLKGNGKVAALELKVQEYVRLLDLSTGQIRVERGPKLVVLGPAEQVIGNKKFSAIEVDYDHAVLVRDKTTGALRLVTEHALFFPGPDDEIEQVQQKIKLSDHEAVVIKNQEGHYSFNHGNEKKRIDNQPRAFFVPPHAEMVTQVWSSGVRRDKRDLRIQILDTRAQYMYFEFNCRTSDNVELILEGTFFWQVSDIQAMMRTTGDVPGDVCNHARSQFIRLVSRVTLKEFMSDIHAIAGKVHADSDFYKSRGIKIRSLEVTRYACAEDSTAKILEEIIQETTQRMNRLSQAESENEVNIFKMGGMIEQEKLKTKLMEIQHEHLESSAKATGGAEARQSAAFMKVLERAGVPPADRVTMWETVRRCERVSKMAESDCQLYYSAKDIDLSLENSKASYDTRR